MLSLRTYILRRRTKRDLVRATQVGTDIALGLGRLGDIDTRNTKAGTRGILWAIDTKDRVASWRNRSILNDISFRFRAS